MPRLVALAGTLSREAGNEPPRSVYAASSGTESREACAHEYTRWSVSEDGSNLARRRLSSTGRGRVKAKSTTPHDEGC